MDEAWTLGLQLGGGRPPQRDKGSLRRARGLLDGVRRACWDGAGEGERLTAGA